MPHACQNCLDRGTIPGSVETQRHTSRNSGTCHTHSQVMWYGDCAKMKGARPNASADTKLQAGRQSRCRATP